MIYISSLELPVTASTGIDVINPASPATNTLHTPLVGAQTTVDAAMETAPQLFDTTFPTLQFRNDLR